MGPRKQLASRSKRPIPPRQPLGGERRTKARHDPIPTPSSRVPSSPPPPPTVPPTSRVSSSSPAAERMAGRVIACGRRINLVYFEAHGFTLGQWVRLAGCENFCTLRERFYPHLIREFYGSLVRGADGWTATVRGVSFVITAEILGQIWSIPCLGPITDSLADREAGIRCILERADVRGVTSVSAIQLSAEMRLLHHIVARIFLPKTGRFDYITERELMVMTTLVRGLVLNFPGVLFRQMQEAAESRRLCLPYGMALTLVFRHFGVPLEGELYRELHHTDTYDDRSLHRMGYRFTAGRWTRRTSGQEPVSDSEEDEIRAAEAGPSAPAADEEGEPTTPPVRPAPSPRPTTSIDQIMIDRVVEAVTSSVRTEIASLRAELGELRTETHTSLGVLRASMTELQSGLQAGIQELLTAIQRSTSVTAPHSSDSSSDSSSSPSEDQPHDQAATTVQDSPIAADQASPFADPDPPPADQDPIIRDAELPASEVPPSASQPSETPTDSPAADAPPEPTLPSSSSRALGFHTPGFFSPPRRSSGRTKRISYRTSTRHQTPQIIDCSSDSDA